MSIANSDEEIESVGIFSDHVLATVKRNNEIVGSSESQGRGRAASCDHLSSGKVRIDVSGVAPRNEEGTMATCQRLLARINEGSVKWGELAEAKGVPHIDAFAPGEGENAGSTLTIQVVRALTDCNFWQSLGVDGRAMLELTLPEASDMLKKAIHFKAGRIPADSRQTLTLALDATDLPGLALDTVVAQFKRMHAIWVKTQGFASVWVVGPSVEMVHQLRED